jgi:hypothetical protein
MGPEPTQLQPRAKTVKRFCKATYQAKRCATCQAKQGPLVLLG